MKRVIIILTAIIALSSCHKSEVDCTYIITPYFQDEDAGPVEVCGQTEAYVFYADTAQWEVASYQDAVTGVITERTGSGKRNFDIIATVDDNGRLMMGPVTHGPVLIVVCDKDIEAYAWRQMPAQEDIAQILVSVTFRTWQTSSPYLDSKWTVTNSDPPRTVDCDYTITSLVRATSDAPTVPCANPVAHAFYADTTAWKVASLADAIAGKITEITSGSKTRNFDLQAQVQAGGVLFFDHIVRRRVMFVVCDADLRSYCVKQVEIGYNEAQIGDQLTFTPWKGYPYYDNGWKTFYEAPPEPDPEP